MASNRIRWGVLAAVALGGFAIGRMPDPIAPVAAISVLGVAAIGGLIWRSRAQATRRWRAALDAYADRALARQRRRVA